jgi:hypothetical protein
MSTLRSAIWRIAQSTTECNCAICTSCTGSGRIASPGSQAAARQPSSRTPAQQQDASPAAGRQPSSRPPARQQAASPAAGRQPGSSPPARQQAASPAADHRPGSYVIYAPARAGAPAPRRSNVPACVRGRGEGTARAPAGYAGSGARKLGRFVIFFGISVRAGRKKWGLKLSGKG